MNTENKQKVIDFLQKSTLDIDFKYHLSNEDFESAEDVRSILEDAGAFDTEIIYYSNAIKYLSENDSSLNRSLGIASDMGYEPKNLNSEILASILASEINREEWSELESELQTLIDELLELESIEE
jgi:hypothetical protein